jgi:hypothetical protein
VLAMVFKNLPAEKTLLIFKNLVHLILLESKLFSHHY